MKNPHSSAPRRLFAPPRWVSVAGGLLAGASLVSCQPAPAKVPVADTSVARAALPEPTLVKKVSFRVPDEREVADTNLLAAVRRGRALLRNTRDSLPAFVGNNLQCVSCHAADGTQKNAMPLVGVYARFPQYRGRFGATQIIDDRINDCFTRSMNGKALDPQSRDMRDMVAYMAFLSLGYPVGAEVEGQGFPKVDPLPGDTTRGAALFATKCIACHGKNGEGSDVAPPVWGPHSYNIGAGMARIRTAAGFIKELMPQNAPRTLSAQEAYDLATYVNTRPRPDFRGKEGDWPHGDPPPDVAYPTDAARKKVASK
ncbi:MAG: c-type cytochrome [Gemmatimonadaceae bacterium]